MKITSHFVVPVDRATVWEALHDVPAVSQCVPGARLDEEVSPGRYVGEMRTKFGAAVASFKGEAISKFDDEAHVVTLDAKGVELRGRNPVKCKVTIALNEDAGGRTRGDVVGEFTFTGPLASVAATGGKKITEQLISEFATNLAARLSVDGEVAEPAAELQVGALAFRAWRRTWRERWARWTSRLRRRTSAVRG